MQESYLSVSLSLQNISLRNLSACGEMQAFCACYFRSVALPKQAYGLCTLPSTPTVITPYARAAPKSSRSKRPRPEKKTSGFGDSKTPSTAQNDSDQSTQTQMNVDHSSSEDVSEEERRQRDLKKLDNNGISLEHRLREEILHPLRKPKQTLFGTLTFSASLGFLIACARLATARDTPDQVFVNISVDVAALALFGYLTWREFDFGRRSLNSIAGRPEPRDLPIVPLLSSFPSRLRFRLPFRPVTADTAVTTDCLSSLLSRADAVIVAGRVNDLRKYLDRCVQSADYQSNDQLSKYNSKHPLLVAFAIDGRDSADAVYTGATAVAPRDKDKAVDWINWLGDAVPPRRNVALFKIDARAKPKDSANAYVVTIDDPMTVPLPAEAKRHVVVEV